MSRVCLMHSKTTNKCTLYWCHFSNILSTRKILLIDCSLMMPHILIGLGQNWFTQWLNTSFRQSTISPNFHHWRPMVCGQLSKVNRMYLKTQQLQPFSWGRWLTHFGWIGVANCCMLSFMNSILCNRHVIVPRVGFIRVYDIQMCIIVNVFVISVLKMNIWTSCVCVFS